jgi:hypothetical protein
MLRTTFRERERERERERQMHWKTSWNTLVTTTVFLCHTVQKPLTGDRMIKRKRWHKARFVASCQIINKKVRVWFQSSPYGVYGGRKWYWDGFLSGYCCYLESIVLPPQQYCHIPSSALVAVESQLRQMNHSKTSEEYTYAMTLYANVLCNYC